MNRRSILMLSILALLLLPACAATPHAASAIASSPPRPARINHLVFFRLKNSADADELIRDCDALLAHIPGVVSYFAGKHFDAGRANVDSNYDVGFYVGLMTADAYAAYVQHPDHLAAVSKWKPRCEWIRIQNVIDDSP